MGGNEDLVSVFMQSCRLFKDNESQKIAKCWKRGVEQDLGVMGKYVKNCFTASASARADVGNGKRKSLVSAGSLENTPKEGQKNVKLSGKSLFMSRIEDNFRGHGTKKSFYNKKSSLVSSFNSLLVMDTLTERATSDGLAVNAEIPKGKSKTTFERQATKKSLNKAGRQKTSRTKTEAVTSSAIDGDLPGQENKQNAFKINRMKTRGNFFVSGRSN
jgi:hypothetical protein